VESSPIGPSAGTDGRCWCGKLFAGGGLLLTGSLSTVLVLESNVAVLGALVVAFIGIGFAGPNYWAIAQLVSPESVIGLVVGYVNTVGNIAGICAPLVTGILVGLSGNFRASLLCAASAMLLGSFLFLAGMRESDMDMLRTSRVPALAPTR
jgi:hypothetical protein